MILTENENKVLKAIEDCMDWYNDGFSDMMVDDIAVETKLSIKTVKGVLGSLVKKDLVTYQDVNGEYNVYYSTRWEIK